jgi:Fur family transcriptional regulator, ferric uptake regulator
MATRTTGESDPHVHRTAAERLRRDGQRYTTSRRTLVEVLESTDRPLTIPELMAQRVGIPQSSAYRNLAVLERAGVVDRVVATDEFIRYELAEDLTEHHHHMICAGCGSVADFVMTPAEERRLTAAADAIAGEAGFQVASHRFDLLGRCGACEG